MCVTGEQRRVEPEIGQRRNRIIFQQALTSKFGAHPLSLAGVSCLVVLFAIG